MGLPSKGHFVSYFWYTDIPSNVIQHVIQMLKFCGAIVWHLKYWAFEWENKFSKFVSQNKPLQTINRSTAYNGKSLTTFDCNLRLYDRICGISVPATISYSYSILIFLKLKSPLWLQCLDLSSSSTFK